MTDKQLRHVRPQGIRKNRVAKYSPRRNKAFVTKSPTISPPATLQPDSEITLRCAKEKALRHCTAKRVLVIAAHTKQGDAIATTLRTLGYLPMTVPSLSQGLAWLNFTRPDLLIVDMATTDASPMPAEGWHLLSFRELPVVFIAPQDIDPLEARKIAAIGNGVLVSPWHREQLGAIVDMTLAGASWNRFPNRSFFDAIPEALLLVDLKDNRLLDANESACGLFGRSINDVLTCTLDQLVQGISPVGENSEKRRAIARLQRIDGQSSGIFVEIEQRLLSIKGRQTAMIILRDARSNHLDHDNKSLLTLATEQSPCAVIICDNIGQIQYVNSQFTTLTGYSFAEALDKNISFLNSEYHDRSYFSEIWAKIQTNTRWQGEVCNKTKDGDVFWGQVSISGILDSSGIISQYVIVINDITARKNEEDKLRFQAMYDPLTKIPNRRLFVERLEYALSHQKSANSLTAVLYLDLDNFKVINDTFGHDHGDKLLCEVGRRLKHCLRTNDTVARFGGDEFAMLLQDLHSIDCAYTVIAKLQQAFRQPYKIMGQELRIQGSLGLSCFPGDGECVETLIQVADARMYLSKNQALNRRSSLPFSFIIHDASAMCPEQAKSPQILPAAVLEGIESDCM